METMDQNLIAIDELNLDRECLKLPEQTLKFSLEAARRRKHLDQAKAELEVVKAEVSGSIRANPSTYGLEKVTEGALANAVLLQSNVQLAEKAVVEAKFRHEEVMAVVAALETKRKSLEMLVQLHAMGYFAAPRLKGKGKEAMESLTQEKVRRGSV